MISWFPTEWDRYFLEMAKQASTRSKDPSTKTGAVIVRPDRTVASIGYNGFPRKMQDTEERLNNRPEKYSRIIHCEINALLFLHEKPINYTLYTYPFLTCDRCAVQVIQSGIVRVIAPICPAEQRERWELTFRRTREFYHECGVECREVPYSE